MIALHLAHHHAHQHSPQPVGASNSAFWPLFRAPMSLLMKASWTPAVHNSKGGRGRGTGAELWVQGLDSSWAAESFFGFHVVMMAASWSSLGLFSFPTSSCQLQLSMAG
eukprot:428407-Pelagomonas_calceolata.AAC.2